MLTLEERRQLALMLQEDTISNTEKKRRSEEWERERDEKGRFLPKQKERKQVESRYESCREIKLVKVKGSYGTFKVKTKMLSTGEWTYLIFFVGFMVLAIII